MVQITLLIAIMAILGVRSEPPVDRQYLPPSDTGYPANDAPSAEYGAPISSNQQNGLSEEYGPPSFAENGYNGRPLDEYGPPSNGFGSRDTPSVQYGAPSNNGGTNGRFGNSGRPSAEYGVPANTNDYTRNGFSSQYDMSGPEGMNEFGIRNAPSTQYGAPRSGSNGARLSDTYGPPSSRFDQNDINQPSPQYGVPVGQDVPGFTTNGGNRPSARYGAPSAIRIGQNGNGRADTTYRSNGASQVRSNIGSRPSAAYGAPASNGFNQNNGGRLSAEYGAPRTTGFTRTTGAQPISTYGAPNGARLGQNGNGRPSTSYSAPSSSRFGQNGGSQTTRQFGSSVGGNGAATRSGAPSQQYGVPANGNRLGSDTIALAPYSSNGGGPYPAAGYNRKALQDDDLAEPANYEFQYEVNDAETGSEFQHEESRQDDNAIGSYSVVLPDGRRQIVEYQADQEGFQPNIRYEDTGRGSGYSNGNGGYNYSPGSGNGPSGRNGGYNYDAPGSNGRGRY